MAAMRSSLVGDLIDPFLSKIVLGKALSQFSKFSKATRWNQAFSSGT
jgi:hypothetical protein